MRDSDFASTDQAQPLSKTAYVLSRLREDLRTGKIHPGQQLRQVELARRYGVSPTPVREALRLLEADGSVSYSPHRGATVAELQPEEVDDLYRVRGAVEPLLARMAAERATAGHVDGVRAIHEDLAEIRDDASPDELSARNREFHLAILRIASPMITQQIVAPMWEHFLPPSRSLWQSPERNAIFVAEHERILQALEVGDPSGTEVAMAAHLATAGRIRTAARRRSCADSLAPAPEPPG